MAKMARPTSQSHRGEFTMTDRLPAGLLALAFSLIIALPANAQDLPTMEEKGRVQVIGGMEGPPPPPAPITPEKKALMKELLGLMKASDNSETIANQFMDQLQPAVASGISNHMRGWIQAQKWPPAEQKRMEALVDETVQRILTRIRAEVPKRVNFAELVEKVAVEVYNKHFTEAEVKDLIAFYKTSTAQKFARIQPQIVAELASRAGNAIVPDVTPLISEIVDTETMKLTQKRN
jgi:hypothetical protein